MSRQSERLRFKAKALENPKLSEVEKNAIACKEIANQIVWLRRNVREMINRCQVALKDKQDFSRLMAASYGQPRSNTIPLYQEESIATCLDIINYSIGEYNRYLSCCGEQALFLLEWFERSGATVHDFCQVAGINFKTAQKALQDLKDCRTIEDTPKEKQYRLFVDLIFVCNAELPLSVGNVDSVWGYEEDMPLFFAIFQYFSGKMREDRQFKEHSCNAL